MTTFEKSAIIGYYRMGMSYRDMGLVMGISESYARLIVKEYLATKPQNLKDN